MKVELKNHWFGPDSTLREPGIHDVPDELEDFLPTSSIILDDEGQPDKAANKAKADRAAGVADETKKASPEVAPKGTIDGKGNVKV